MTRAQQQRSVAVVLTAALLAVLAAMGGAHATAQRQQRASATPQHAASAGAASTHHLIKHDAPSAVVHLDLSTGPVDAWSPQSDRSVETAGAGARATLPLTSTSHDSRAPPTA
ncbi:MAG: hypothetical protein EON52_15130 [Actinomycetales bacterium]|nr:MAG: hypothetical protein EON52_15130 [Actinomycetales bacterium]